MFLWLSRNFQQRKFADSYLDSFCHLGVLIVVLHSTGIKLLLKTKKSSLRILKFSLYYIPYFHIKIFSFIHFYLLFK